MVFDTPAEVSCRMCGQSLTGNAVADQHTVANFRLAMGLDILWQACEKWCGEKSELQQDSKGYQMTANPFTE